MALISSWPVVFKASSSSFANVSSLTLLCKERPTCINYDLKWANITVLCNFAETTEDTEGDQENFTNAKEEAIDEEKAGQEAEAGLDQWQDYIPTLLY